MGTRTAAELKISVLDPVKILDMDPRNRYKYFCEWKNNSADELSVIFSEATKTLFFSDRIPEKDIFKYGNMFMTFATRKSYITKPQTARFNAIRGMFGEDGANTALDLYFYLYELRS